MLSVIASAGCGSDQAAGKPSVSAAPAADGPPIFVGQCGSAGDAEVGDAAGAGPVRLVSSDPLTCRWEAAEEGSDVTFKWFRGSPLDDYRGDDPASRAARATIDIGGHRGYAWQATRSCETAVGSGGGDFITWTVESATTTAAADCAAATKLSSATLATR